MASSSRLQAVYFLVLSINLIFFTLVSSTRVQCRPPPPPPGGKCPRDALKLGVCADLLKGLLGLVLGTPPRTPCCSIIQGLADLEAAVCLCTALKGSVLGLVNLDLPLSLTLLVNYCGKNVPSDYECA